ncbi:MAG: OmpH family outer membrane protein [Acidobacteriota bacterium]|nr:OmpH family outer membrane protein [Acidobacteriota bacterium]
MRKFVAALTMIAVAGGFAALYAQQGKIGVINSQEVLEKSVEGKKVIARIQEKDKQYQASITKLDDDIRQIQTKLNTQRLTLTEEAAAAAQADLDKKTTDRKRMAEDAYAGMQDLTSRLFKRVQDELIPIVEALGKERGYDLIFDLQKSGAAWVSPAIDMTAELIKRYDASKAVPSK